MMNFGHYLNLSVVGGQLPVADLQKADIRVQRVWLNG
jgi:hypothetical protein